MLGRTPFGHVNYARMGVVTSCGIPLGLLRSNPPELPYGAHQQYRTSMRAHSQDKITGVRLVVTIDPTSRYGTLPLVQYLNNPLGIDTNVAGMTPAGNTPL